MLPKLVLSVFVGAAIAAIVSRNGLPLVPRRASFAHLQPWAIPSYIAIVLVTHWFRAARWRYLIAPVKDIPLREVVFLNWIGFFAIFAFPFRLGEAVRPALTKLRHGVPVSAGIGTVAVERIVDGLVASLAVAYALFGMPRLATTDPIARHLPAYGMLALAIFGAAFAAIFLFLWKRELMTRLVGAVLGIVSRPLAEFVTTKIASLSDGLRSMSELRYALPFLAETLVYWGTNAFSMWVLAIGCGLPLEFGHAVAIMGVLAIGILLPAGPGMFGPFQLALAAGLSCYVPESVVTDQGALYIFVLYACQAAVIGLAGIVPLYLSHVHLGDLIER